MSYPGGGHRTYGGYDPNSYQNYDNQGGYGNQNSYGNNQGYNQQDFGYNQNGYGGGGYNNFGGPPPGPPPNQGYGGPPLGPPPGPPPSYGGGYGGGYNNGNNYNSGSTYTGNNGGFDDYNSRDYNHGSWGAPGGYDNPNFGGNHSTSNMQFQPPPSQGQSFGVNGMQNYMYSQCTGRRKALLIGINYFRQKSELKGCINDVRNIRNFLTQRYGYKAEDMVVLTDDQSNPQSIPTKANILRACQWLVRDARPHDSLFFHYSGHGGQEKDLDGDEDDGYDECIYPVDYATQGSIVDDILHDILVRPLPPGARLTALMDCCHSATALDLPYVYSTKGTLKEPNLLKDTGKNMFNAFSSYASGDIGGVVSSVSGAIGRFTKGNKGTEITKKTKTSPADVIMFSGCKDSQTSADSFEDGAATGAMSHAFIQVMSNNPNQSYLSLLNNMRDVLAGKYDQKPQLSCSHPLDCNLKFIM